MLLKGETSLRPATPMSSSEAIYVGFMFIEVFGLRYLVSY